jgi:uncharacterized protein (TIGR02246 family)
MLVLMIIVTLVLCLTITLPATAASDEDEALEVVKNFTKAISTSDYELMMSLYWKSSKLTGFGPGYSNLFLTEGLENTDWAFLKDQPVGSLKFYFRNPKVTMIKDDVAIVTGYHTVVSTDQTTNEESVGHIRQTFVVQKIGGKWLIVHNHASYIPTE